MQAAEPTYPTVVPACDFDPDKDAARIETAIKTKGKKKSTDHSAHPIAAQRTNEANQQGWPSSSTFQLEVKQKKKSVPQDEI